MFSKHFSKPSRELFCAALYKNTVDNFVHSHRISTAIGNVRHAFSLQSSTTLLFDHVQTPALFVRNKGLHSKRTNLCGEVTRSNIGQEVVLCGWLQYHRMNGRFLILRDWTGLIQTVLSDEIMNEIDAEHIEYESVIEVIGEVRPRPEGQENKNMKTGEIEVKAKQVKILNRCRQSLPLEIGRVNQSKESLRMEYRYLDIRNQFMQSNLRTRSNMVMKMREFLCNKHGFVDVETPTLFRRTPGGAKEFVVPTRQSGKFYSLPQSPQQFKQLLMVGGIDRYFQIAKCYRDEGARQDRQPEFTQVDLEVSFTTQREIQDLVEDLLQYSWPEGKLTLPFPEISYTEAMTTYGTDKPDTRFELKLVDVADCLRNSGIHSFEDILTQDTGQVIAFKIPSGSKYLSNKDVNSILTDKDKVVNSQVQTIRVNDKHEWKCPFQKYLNKKTKQRMTSCLNIEPGDIVILAAGLQYNQHVSLGRIRVALADLLESKGLKLRDENKFNFLWVTDFPLFLPKEEGEGLESAHHPFTAPHSEDIELVKTDPEKVRSQHYDLVLNGYEIGGGSIRIHQADLQRYVLTDILQEDTSQLEHLLEALSYGCPPHGGIALGLDRLLAVICRTLSIRDVIAFPKSAEGRDTMSKAPTFISQTDLDLYHIAVKSS